MSINVQYNANSYTSGSYDFYLTTNQYIELAYTQIGLKRQNQSLTPEQYETGRNILNAMVKSWATDNIFIWNLDWFTLPLHDSDIRNVNGVDYQCIRNHISSLENQPGVGATQGSYWEALSSNSAVPWAVDNNYVTAGNYYLNNEIIGIECARIKENDGGYTLLHPFSESDFFSLGSPNTTGQTTRYYFRKKKTPEVFLYPVPDNTTDYSIEFSAYRYPQDFDSNGNYADFLQEWSEALYMGLAVRLAVQNGIFGQRLQDLKVLAEEAKENARACDHESGDFFIKPALRGYGGVNNGYV